MDSPHGPTYVSAKSAEGILSDIRPITLTGDCLKSANVFLDELLYSILAASRSLLTPQIKLGLLKVLPTPIGKEALLEAEMELRNYVDRSGPAPTTSDASDFHLQWSFEILRLKCAAYSTLSDADEDAQAEANLNDRMGRALRNVPPPKSQMVAPAALYLTAIIESVCDHILTAVGRVAARDSSRACATVQDLFVALCEDDAIYNFFRTMKVYEKIESLALMPYPRRSKSFNRGEPATSPLLQSHSISPSVSGPGRSRNSSESHPSGPARSSIDKGRGLNPFKSNGKENGEGAHKRTTSALSENARIDGARGSLAAGSDYGDSDFEDMMRSGSTMKMSLTPDRLRTMESIKDKSLKGKRSLSKTSLKLSKSDSATNPDFSRSLAGSQIKEDEEEHSPSRSYANRNHSPSTPPTSMQSALNRAKGTTTTYVSPNSTLSAQGRSRNASIAESTSSAPTRTRRVQKATEDIDLDDIVGDSDDDTFNSGTPRAGAKSTTGSGKVSTSTRELMDFLNTGPPDESRGQLPMNGSNTSLDGGKSTKSQGKLKSMFSRIGGSKRANDKLSSRYPSSIAPSSPPPRQSPSLGSPPSSFTPIGAAYTKPVPPRPAPTSPIQSQASLEAPERPNRGSPTVSPAEPSPLAQLNTNSSLSAQTDSSGTTTNGRSFKSDGAPKRDMPIINDSNISSADYTAKRTSQRIIVETKAPPPKYFEHAHDLKRALATATTVDECRLLVDLFLAKAGMPSSMPKSPLTEKAPAVPSIEAQPQSQTRDVEITVVELFLGETRATLPKPPQAKPIEEVPTENLPTDARPDGNGLEASNHENLPRKPDTRPLPDTRELAAQYNQ